jgi:antitoxin component YwqK of YwqJK toxin-antitoxin module
MRNLFFYAFVFIHFCFEAQTTDANGNKQGYWKKKDEKTNKLVYEGEFKNNKPLGKFKYYYPNDSVRAIMHFKLDGKVAYAKLFHLNGIRMGEGKYIQEIKDSTWLYYDESGKLLSKDNYSMGKKNGVSYVYLPNGKLAEERQYKMDVQHGPFKQYIDGKRLRGEGNYLDGQLDGKATYYYPNSVEVATGYYKNGMKNGPWIYKEESGKIKERELYINGKLASAKETEAFFQKNKSLEKKDIKSTNAKTNSKAQAANKSK